MTNSKNSYDQFGLLERDLNYIISTISDHKEIETAVIFGSRAKGTYKKGSDIDLALKGLDISPKIIKKISVQLNEYLPIPFFVDVVDYTHLKKETLKKHIEVFGKIIYKKEVKK